MISQLGLVLTLATPAPSPCTSTGKRLLKRGCVAETPVDCLRVSPQSADFRPPTISKISKLAVMDSPSPGCMQSRQKSLQPCTASSLKSHVKGPRWVGPTERQKRRVVALSIGIFNFSAVRTDPRLSIFKNLPRCCRPRAPSGVVTPSPGSTGHNINLKSERLPTVKGGETIGFPSVARNRGRRCTICHSARAPDTATRSCSRSVNKTSQGVLGVTGDGCGVSSGVKNGDDSEGN